MATLLVQSAALVQNDDGTSSSRRNEQRRRQLTDTIPDAPYAFQLSGGIADLTYLLDIKVGSPPSLLQARIDTGSTTTFLPSQQVCPACTSGLINVNKNRVQNRTVPDTRGLSTDSDYHYFNCSTSFTCDYVACDSNVCTGTTCDEECLSHDLQPYEGCEYVDKAEEGCCATHSPTACGFSTSYTDGSVVAGALATDDIILGVGDSKFLSMPSTTFGKLKAHFALRTGTLQFNVFGYSFLFFDSRHSSSVDKGRVALLLRNSRIVVPSSVLLSVMCGQLRDCHS